MHNCGSPFANTTGRLALLTALLVTSFVPSLAHAQEYKAKYLADVGHTDGEEHAAGSTFEWAWSIRNDGTATWVGQDVRLKQYGGQILGTVADSDTIEIAPGASATVTVTGLTAPATPGLYRQYFHIYRGNTDFSSGLGFWAEITVVEGGGSALDAVVEQDVTIPAMSCVVSGVSATKTWRVRNTGTEDWRVGDVKVVHTDGPAYATESEWNIPRDVAAGDSVDLSIQITPTGTGQQEISKWSLAGATGVGDPDLFGPDLLINFDAQSSCDGSSGCDGKEDELPGGQPPVACGCQNSDPAGSALSIFGALLCAFLIRRKRAGQRAHG
jgi:hypothetical protein